VAILPTLITLGNGICGVASIYSTTQGDFVTAAWAILAGLVFDGLDGKVARATRSASAFGTQLDSLCDAVTFGVAPSALLVALLTKTYGAGTLMERALWVIGILFACGAIIRLARFNVETSETDSHSYFSGLPSPGAGGTIASAVLTSNALKDNSDWAWLLPTILPILMLALGLLMVSRIRYVHLMNRLLRGFRPFPTFVEAALVLALVVILREGAVFAAFLGYSLSGPALALRRVLAPPSRRVDGIVPEKPHDPSVH
jgi:CDP-diacylglycerol--serine O-phosphatidyltransferase